MSGHERERLSAHLDGELDPAARAEVEAHLASCPECTALLADLAAVDEAARVLPDSAPAGYFDSFPARVRARLQPRPARVQPRRVPPLRRLPAWTWAAAAALLLAVVTPLTLRQGRPAAEEARRDDENAPAATGGPSPSQQVPAQVRAPEPKSQATPAPGAPSRVSSSAPFPRSDQRRAAPPATREAGPQARRDQPAEGRFALEPAPPATAVPPSSPELGAGGESGAAAGGVVAGAMDGVVPQESSSREKVERSAPRPAVQAGAAAPMTASQSAREAKPARLEAQAAKLEAEADAFGRLEAARPRTAAGWRSVREQWKALAAAEADPVRADEERVRAVIALREAWRAEGGDSDEAAFRAEAESYLQRDDARQKGRVEGLLAEAARRAP